MADGPVVGSAYLRIFGDFSQVNSQAVGLFSSPKWQKMGKVAGGALAAGVVAGGAAKALYDIGAAFDEVTDKFRTQTGATGKELGKLQSSFKKVLGTVPTDFGTASDAVAGLHQRLDLVGKPLTRLARQITALSEITGTDAAENVRLVTRLFGDWSVKTSKQSGTLDKLFRLTQETGVAFTDLSDLMVQFGSPLRQLGFSFDEAAVMFARFEKEGVNMQTLLPGLRMALKNIAVPTDELGKQFKQLGIDTRNPHDALLQIFDLISGSKLKSAEKTLLASQVFGGRAWADMKAAIEEGRFEFEDLIKSMNRGDETISKSERSTRDFSEQWQLFTNRLKVLVEPVATKVFELVGKGMKALNKLDFKQAIAAMRDFWDKAGLLRDILKRVGGQVKETLGGMVDGIKAGVKLISSILSGDFKSAWQAVKDIFKAGIKIALAPLKAAVGLFGDVASRIGNAIASAFDGVWDRVKSIFQGGLNVVIDVVNAVLDVIEEIPGVGDFDPIGHVGDDGPGRGRGGQTTDTALQNDRRRRMTVGHRFHQELFTGGKITKQMAIVGEEAPQHPEYVLATNPAYRERNRELWMRAGHDLGIPGFQQGGVVPTDAAGSLAHGAGWFIDKLPDVSGIPGVFGGLGKYIIDKASAFIRDKVKSVADAILPGNLGPNEIKGLEPLKLMTDATSLAQSFGLAVTSGVRSGSTYHNPGYDPPHLARDFSNSSRPTPEMRRFALAAIKRYGVGKILELFYNPLGFQIDNYSQGPMTVMDHYDHVHLAFRQGGVIGAAMQMLAEGGVVGKGGFSGGVVGRPIPKALQKYNKIWPNNPGGDAAAWAALPSMPFNDIAMLAEFFGMPGITMAQITKGESGGKPGSLEIGASGQDGTRGVGLWAITPHYADGLRGPGGPLSGDYQPEMFNPIANAIIAAKMAKAAGGPNSGIWHGSGAVTGWNLHWNGDFGEIVSARGGGDDSDSDDAGGGGGSETEEDKPAIPQFGPLPKTIEACKAEIREVKRILKRDKDPSTDEKLTAKQRGAYRKRLKDLRTKLKELRRRQRVSERISLSGLHPELARKLRNIDERIIRDEDRVATAERLAGSFGSPANEDIDAGELAQLVGTDGKGGLYGDVIFDHTRRRDIAAEQLGHAVTRLARVDQALASKKLPGWKRAAYKANRKSLRTLIKDSKAVVLEEQGPEGKSGLIFDWTMDAADLFGSSTASSTETGDDPSASLLQQLLEQERRSNAILRAQQPIFDFFSKVPFGGSFAEGGIVPGPQGAPRMVLAHGGEEISQPGSPQIEVNVYNDPTTLEQTVDVLIDGKLQKAVRAARGAGPVVGRKAGAL